MNGANKLPRIVAAVARIDNPPKPTRQQRLKQHRQLQAWRRKAQR
ncbi:MULTISPECIES: hypothetical protein [Mycobacterium]|nr:MULTISPECIES: hypothetical protein [Mycobacterium]